VQRLTTPDGRRELLERARRSYDTLRTAVLSGAAGASVGARLRGVVDRRSASRAFGGTPCSTLPPTGSGRGDAAQRSASDVTDDAGRAAGDVRGTKEGTTDV